MSCARAVAITGGPAIRVRLGRVDAEGPDPPGRMPELTLSAAQLKAHFAHAGFTAKVTRDVGERARVDLTCVSSVVGIDKPPSPL